jgi:hypothetical protein
MTTPPPSCGKPVWMKPKIARHCYQVTPTEISDEQESWRKTECSAIAGHPLRLLESALG